MAVKHVRHMQTREESTIIDPIMEEDTPAPLTLGEKLAHVPRARIGTAAVFGQIWVPGGFTLTMVYTLSPSFFISVPWRLALLLSWMAYMSLVLMVLSYAELFLPRTPVAVAEKIENVGAWVVGVFGMGLMVSSVFATEIVYKDTHPRVLAGCTAVVAAFIAGLVAFWVRLARKYGGGGEELPSENGEPACTARRLPV